MKTLDMTTGNPVKLIIQFSVPILLGSLLQQIYSLVDRVIVGQFVGDMAYNRSYMNCDSILRICTVQKRSMETKIISWRIKDMEKRRLGTTICM